MEILDGHSARGCIGDRIDPRIGRPLQVEEREHTYRCRACGAWVDCRDLGMVYQHEGPLPHPAGDRDQQRPSPRRDRW
jgi:hypothetical protein